MTVSTELSHEEYTGNGVTTDFDFRFRVFKAEHLVVSVADPDGTERILTNGTDYTLRGVGSYRGGKVILKMPLAAGWKIGIARDLPAVQETDLRNQGKFFAEVHEDAFDYLTMLIQKSLGYLSLCLRKPSFISDHYDAKGNKISNLGKPVKDGDAVDLGTMKGHISAKDKRSLRVADKDIPVLPNAANRANKLLSFDDGGNPVVIVPESGSAADVLTELARSTGAGLVGYSFDSTATQRTVKQKLNEMLSIYDFCPVNHSSISDWRPYFEQALVHIEALGGGTLFVPSGKYYLNSYSEIGTIGPVFNAILPLCDNVRILIDVAAEIVVGTFFDDKPFQLFFGSSPLKPNLVDVVNNAVIEGGTISFSGDRSIMRTAPLNRLALQAGNINNLRISNVNFRDGDLTNVLAIGYQNLGKYAVIENCNFINLIQNGENNDHSSIYLNASYSTITNCNFISTKDKGKKVACAVELHKSFNSWIGGNVDGYTRGAYINVIDTESSLVENTIITSVTARILHQFVVYSFGSNGVIRNSLVSGNNVTTLARSSSDTDPSEFGPCSLCGWASYGSFPNADGLNIVVENNTYIVDESVPDSYSCVFYAIANVSGITVRRNTVGARTFFYNPTQSLTFYNCHFYENRFEESYLQSGPSRFLYDLNCKQISQSTFEASVPIKTAALTGVMRIDPAIPGIQNSFVVIPKNTDNIQYPFITNLDSLLGQDGTTYSYPQNCNVNIGSGSTPVLSVTSPAVSTVDRGQILNNSNLPSGYVPPSSLMKYGTTLAGAGATVSGAPSGDYSDVRILLIRER